MLDGHSKGNKIIIIVRRNFKLSILQKIIVVLIMRIEIGILKKIVLSRKKMLPK